MIIQSCTTSKFSKSLARFSEGSDFRVVEEDRNHSVLVLAIHGGKIEKGTSEVAKAIARDDFSLYLFEGIKKRNNFKMHLTSADFDDPIALKMANKSDVCISIHGFNDPEAKFCLGGKNEELKKRVYSKIQPITAQAELNPCSKFYGEEPSNIVNSCRKFGVQIEMSKGLRDRLLKDPAQLSHFARLVRESVL